MDKYTFLRIISDGRDSSVYVVKTEERKQPHILKKIRIPTCFAKSPEHIQLKFELLKKSAKEYLVEYYDLFIDDQSGFIYLSSEMMQMSLFDKLMALLSANQKLSNEEIVLCISNIGKGLNELHKNGLSHSSLKSSNVFLDSRGNFRLGDVNLFSYAASLESLSKSSFADGSILSPEIWAKSHIKEEKADVWSFGCLIFELLTNRLPFPCETMEGLKRKIMRGAWPKNLIPSNYHQLLDAIFEVDSSKRINIDQFLKIHNNMLKEEKQSTQIPSKDGPLNLPKLPKKHLLPKELLKEMEKRGVFKSEVNLSIRVDFTPHDDESLQAKPKSPNRLLNSNFKTLSKRIPKGSNQKDFNILIERSQIHDALTPEQKQKIKFGPVKLVPKAESNLGIEATQGQKPMRLTNTERKKMLHHLSLNFKKENVLDSKAQLKIRKITNDEPVTASARPKFLPRSIAYNQLMMRNLEKHLPARSHYPKRNFSMFEITKIVNNKQHYL